MGRARTPRPVREAKESGLSPRVGLVSARVIPRNNFKTAVASRVKYLTTCFDMAQDGLNAVQVANKKRKRFWSYQSFPCTYTEFTGRDPGFTLAIVLLSGLAIW